MMMTAPTIFQSITWIFSAIFYVVSGLCLFRMGKRRGLPYYGLVWIPFLGMSWMMGSLVDHYDRYRNGWDLHLRVWCVICQVITLANSYLLMPYLLKIMGDAVQMDAAEGMMLYFAVLGGMILVLMILIPGCVFYVMAYYRFYRSCIPKRAVLLLIMTSVFAFLSIGPMVCMMIAHGKDGGFEQNLPLTQEE